MFSPLHDVLHLQTWINKKLLVKNTNSSTNKKANGKAARELDFIEAARLRDEMFKMQKELEGMKG